MRVRLPTERNSVAERIEDKSIHQVPIISILNLKLKKINQSLRKVLNNLGEDLM